jgi:RHS repeat-associated protein
VKNQIALTLLVATLCLYGTESFAAVGRTVGQFNVSPTGSAQYSIPIWAPPGPRGMQPQISLIYSSQSSIGPVGVGWIISGLGSITRCNKTYAQDGAPGLITLATSDGYCINGNRLRLTSATGTYGAPSSTYQTEIADFSNITASSTSTGGGPSYFTVKGRNGLTYMYGYTDGNGNGANSQVLAYGATPATASAWMLSKVIDRAGNNYVINYTALEGAAIPNTILWTPASSGSSTYEYTMQFNYTANVAASSIYGFIAGTPVVNAKLLSSITVSYSGTVVKNYALNYQLSPTTGRNELITVTECATTGTTKCLSPTTVGYQSGAEGVATSPTTTPVTTPVTTNVRLQTQWDFNGDGYPDIIFVSGGIVYVSFGSASGYGTPVSTGISSANLGPVGDLLGSGKAGILGNVSNTWYYYTWNGSSFSDTTTHVSYTGANTALIDVNGDGLPDLVTWTTSATTVHISTQLNNGLGSAVSFSTTVNDAFDYTCAACTANEIWAPGQLGPGDKRSWSFAGDGGEGILWGFTEVINNQNWYGIEGLAGNGTTFTEIVGTVSAAGGPLPPVVADWNNDGCDDLIWYGSVLLSECGSAGSNPISILGGGTQVAVLDWNGDGRPDLIVDDGGYIGVYLSTGNGVATIQSTTIPFNTNCIYFRMDANADGLDDLGCWNTSTNAVSYQLHSGVNTPPDLMNSIADGYGNSVAPTYVPISQSDYEESNPSAFPDAVYPDQNYIGPLYVVNYVVFSDPSTLPGGTYSQQPYYFGAWTNLQGRGFEGFAIVRTIDSRYMSPTLFDRYEYYERAFPFTGMKWQDIWTTPIFYVSQSFATEATPAQVLLSSTTNQERFFPYFTNWTTYRSEMNGAENGDLISTTSTNYTYDSYGNALTIDTTVTDNDPGSPSPNPYVNKSWTINTTYSPDVDVPANQSADLTAWCLNMIDETQVAYSSTYTGSTAVTRTKTFTPDTPTNCRILSSVTEPTANGGLYKVTETLGYDSFGNIATDTVLGNNMPSSPASRQTTLNWGTTGQFLNSITVPIGTVAIPATATTTWSYSSNQALTFGVPDNLKNPNNLTTSWTYDAFGRKAKETRPDNTSTTWTWSACTSFCGWSNGVYQVAQTAYQTNGTTQIRTDTASYDPIDRATQTAGPTVTGATATLQALYNSQGLLAQRSMPFLSGTPYQQSYGYDELNRPLSVTRPISSTNSTPQSTSYTYAGRNTTISDPYGNTKTLINDVNGWLRQTQDALGYDVTRAFDAAGSLTGITDSVGNTLLQKVTIVYGVKPFVTAATDADRGAWIYTVDSLGERTGWTDAKGQNFLMTYDAQSRPVTRVEPDLFTQWTWGTTPGNHNVGQLITECTGSAGACSSSTGYSETRTFDSYGRPYQQSITQGGNPGFDPGGVFLITREYSTQDGRLSTLIYPTSTSSTALTLQYTYQYGLLNSIVDSTDTTAICGTTCTLWTANAMNAFGQVTQETLGNGVVINRAYDPVTSWLATATAGVGGGAALLNQSYLQDENGNVTQRENNTLGLYENFYYDGDNRLCDVVLNGTATKCTTPSIIYDGGNAGPGNITSQAGVGTYTYPAAGQPQPHAVTSLTGTFNGIVNPTFSYDANGNMTGRAGSTISWFSSNYPATISASDATGIEEVQFTYGPDRQRWEQIYTGPSGTEKTYYAGGLVDLVFNGLTYFHHYIYAGSEPIAVYIRTNSGAGSTMNYTLADHQGGVSTIASNAGAAEVNESFSAFGTRRNPTTWSGAPTTADLNTIASLSRQGYTFQTWLGQSMGLNHMNGRVEDAILGRFLSPDPHITDPTSAQSYNRYSYVNNNPLTNIDPTGFDAVADDPPAGGGGGGIDPGPTPTLPPIAPPPTALTGSMIPGVDTGASCYGSCAGQYANSVQVLNTSAPETISATNADGSTSSDVEDADAGKSPTIAVAASGYHWETYGGFNFAALGIELVPYSPGRAAAQFLAIGGGLGAGFALSPVYAGIGATAGALGAGKSSHGNPTSILIGAGLGSLAGGSFAAINDAASLTGLSGAAASVVSGGVAGGGTMAGLNALTGQPVLNNVGYATAISCLGPLASGESMVIGGAGYASDSALGYILNAGSNVFSVALGP